MVIAMKYIFRLTENYPQLKQAENQIIETFNLIKKCFSDNNKMLLCGNGGSAADCEHISGELMKGFLLKRELSDTDKNKFGYISDKLQYGLPCIPLTSFSALMTAVSNDNSADMIFAQAVMSLGKKNDVLLAMSTSGNSKNVVFAAETAKALGMKIISITGANDSLLSEISDVTIKIPENETYKIQELTLPVYHALCADIEEAFFG